jgi:hypothetical protein
LICDEHSNESAFRLVSPAALGLPLRAARLRDGAFRWDLFQDASDPTRMVEIFLVESWVEHLRQHERVTEADRIIQEHLLAFLQPSVPPIVTHLVAGLHRAANKLPNLLSTRSS